MLRSASESRACDIASAAGACANAIVPIGTVDTISTKSPALVNRLPIEVPFNVVFVPQIARKVRMIADPSPAEFLPPYRLPPYCRCIAVGEGGREALGRINS